MTHDYASPGAFADLEDDRDAYAEYVRQITGDGDTIVDCLIDIMEDDDAKPYEKLDAQLLLDSIGYGRLAADQYAAAELQPDDPPAAQPQPDDPDPPRAANPRRPRRPAFTLSEETLFHLPALVREKTDNGKKMADFLNAAINGEIPDFRPRHRIRAARQLAARAYSRDRDPNHGLGEIDPDSTRRLIQTLTTEYKQRKAREEEEAARQSVPGLTDALIASTRPDYDPDRHSGGAPQLEPQTPAQPGGPSEDDAPSQPPDSTGGWYTSVLDPDYVSACPHASHDCGCDCSQCGQDPRERNEYFIERFREYRGLPP